VKGLDVVTSRKSDEWQTPPDVFRPLDAEFGFTLDVAASDTNAMCDRFFTIADNGLAQSWGSQVCWLNPPYSEVGKWIERAHEASRKGATVVCLVPSRTDTKWWHSHAIHADEIRWIKGRVKFRRADRTAGGAPFPSCVLVFRPVAAPCEEGR